MDQEISAQIMQSKCEVSYRFENPSLGPIAGRRAFRIFLDHGNLMNVLDLQTGKEADRSRGTPGLSIVLAWLRGEKKKDQYHYQRLHGKEFIQPSSVKGVGGWFRIEIDPPACLPSK